MYKLNAKSRQGIFETLGMTVEEIIDMDFTVIDEKIARKVKHKITEYIMDDDRLVGRGQVYSVTKRLIPMKKIDKELGKDDRRKSAFVKKNISAI